MIDEAPVLVFIAMRMMFLLAFVPVLLLLRYVLRLEWNRAGLLAGIICALGIGVLAQIPFETHAVRLDMPRPGKDFILNPDK